MTGFEEEENNNDIAFEEVILNLDIDKGGYALSDIRDVLNEKLQDSTSKCTLFLFTPLWFKKTKMHLHLPVSQQLS